VKSVETLFSSVGTKEVGGELLSLELVVEAASDGWRRVSGYSSSKRWIMPWSVVSRKSKRPVRMLAYQHNGKVVKLTVVQVIVTLRLSDKCRLYS